MGAGGLTLVDWVFGGGLPLAITGIAFKDKNHPPKKNPAENGDFLEVLCTF